MPKTCYDAAYPPASPPATDVVLIYAGGDTPHPWTDAEIAAQSARYRLPCWVRSDPSAAGVTPVQDATTFAAWLEAHNVPHGVSVVLDLETAVDPAYVATFAESLLFAGSWRTLPYGSRSTLFGNPGCAGYFTAHPGATEIDTDPGVVATQYAYDGTYDLSWIDDSVVLWDTQEAPAAPVAAPAPVPAPAPAPAPAPQEVSVNVPELAYNGGTNYQRGEWVRIVQWRVGAAVDGLYGPGTKAAVQHFQSSNGLVADGVVGPLTAAKIANG